MHSTKTSDVGHVELNYCFNLTLNIVPFISQICPKTQANKLKSAINLAALSLLNCEVVYDIWGNASRNKIQFWIKTEIKFRT